MAQQIKADKDYTLLTSLLQVADILFKIRERELLPQNLSATAAEILVLVDTMGDDVTPARITRMILREPHSISGILIRMEKQCLLKRTKDMERKNLIRITLTAKGEKALKQAMKLEGTTHVISRLSAEQHRQLKQSLSILKEAGMKELLLSPKALHNIVPTDDEFIEAYAGDIVAQRSVKEILDFMNKVNSGEIIITGFDPHKSKSYVNLSIRLGKKVRMYADLPIKPQGNCIRIWANTENEETIKDIVIAKLKGIVLENKILIEFGIIARWPLKHFSLKEFEDFIDAVKTAYTN